MKLLDRKEEVLNIELTQYGKYLLSMGQFKPEFYAFFDDDVLYDSRYAGVIGETQNDIHDRIKEVPQCAAQYVFHGIETEIAANNKFIRAGERDHGMFSRLSSKKIQPEPERHYALSAPLGTITLESESAPAWSINVLQGEISGSIHYQTGDQPTLKIPLITMEHILYKTVSQKEDEPLEELGGTLLQSGQDSEVGATSDLSFLVRKFKDGSFINVFEDTIVLEIEELNTLFEDENFDIEVFIVEEEIVKRNTREVLIPLKFANKKKELVVNNILLDDAQIKSLGDLQSGIDTSCVEYFFDIFIDENEVDNAILCRFANNKTENTLTGRIVDCVESPVSTAKRLYTSNVQEEDIKKDC